MRFSSSLVHRMLSMIYYCRAEGRMRFDVFTGPTLDKFRVVKRRTVCPSISENALTVFSVAEPSRRRLKIIILYNNMFALITKL